jgi:hypothetical protein
MEGQGVEIMGIVGVWIFLMGFSLGEVVGFKSWVLREEEDLYSTLLFEGGVEVGKIMRTYIIRER